MFGKKKKFEREETPQEIGIGAVEIPTDSRFENAPWYVKWIFVIKTYLSDIDPMNMILIMIGLVWCSAFVIAFIIPLSGSISDVSNRIPMMGGITVAFLVWWLSGLYKDKVDGRKCALSLDGRIIFVSNAKIDALPRSEKLYLVNAFGNPIYNTDEDDPIRYRKQKSISIPKEVIDQFQSVRGMKAVSYSDCKLTQITMENVDYTVFYQPRHISEEKLIKENERMKLIHTIAIETIKKLETDMQRAVKNLRESDRKYMEQFIESMTGLKKAFFGSDLRDVIRQEINFSRSPFRSRFQRQKTGQEYKNPSWSKDKPGGEG